MAIEKFPYLVVIVDFRSSLPRARPQLTLAWIFCSPKWIFGRVLFPLESRAHRFNQRVCCLMTPLEVLCGYDIRRPHADPAGV